MIDLHDIRYVRVGTRDLDLATKFSTDFVGLQVVDRDSRHVWLKSDDRDHTLCYFLGEPNESAPAFELSDPDSLEAVAAHLEDKGHKVIAGTREECDIRRVRDFVSFRDPSGNRIELVSRPFHSGVRFHGTRDAGIRGFNHIGLKSSDPRRDEAFWTNVCGARVSDWIGDAALLRVNSMHHTLALFPSPHTGVQHINHQVDSIDDVMRSWYWLKDRQVRIVFGPGRHPASGAMFLYFEGPDRLVFEYSVGVDHIKDEANHRPRQFPFGGFSMCMWGAKPDMVEFKH